MPVEGNGDTDAGARRNEQDVACVGPPSLVHRGRYRRHRFRRVRGTHVFCDVLHPGARDAQPIRHGVCEARRVRREEQIDLTGTQVDVAEEPLRDLGSAVDRTLEVTGFLGDGERVVPTGCMWS